MNKMSILKKIRSWCPQPRDKLITKLKRHSTPIAALLTMSLLTISFSIFSSNYLLSQPAPPQIPVVVNPPPSSSSSNTSGSAPEIEWQKTYRTGASSSNLIQTSDGGYAIAGNVVVHSYITANPPHVWFVKADATGKMEWNQTYDHMHDAVGLVQTRDGGYVLAGNSYTTDANKIEDISLFKTDSNGSVQWSQTYKYWSGGASCMVQTNDGGYVIAGKSGNSGFLIKPTASGRIQWNGTYGEPDKDNRFSAVIQTGDGGYALAGKTSFNGSDASWLVKTDQGGNVVWNQTYRSRSGTDDTTFDNEATSVVQTGDGGYALAANQRTYNVHGEGSEVLLVKTDSLGDIVWNQTFADYTYVYSIIQTSDGGLAFAANTHGSAWLVKLDAAGNEEWNQTYPNRSQGGDGWSACRLIETSDGGFALAGTWSHTSSGHYYFLVKTEPVLPPPTPTPTPSLPPSTGFLSGENLVLFVSIAVAIVLITLAAVAVFRQRKKQTSQTSPTSFT